MKGLKNLLLVACARPLWLFLFLFKQKCKHLSTMIHQNFAISLPFSEMLTIESLYDKVGFWQIEISSKKTYGTWHNLLLHMCMHLIYTMDITFPSDWKNGEGWGRWYILFSHLAWSLRGWLKQWHWTNYLNGGWSIAHTCHFKNLKMWFLSFRLQ